ncbi:MAG TPA: hypothetical protein VNJ08_16260 [Bacteriovoracaceae bacterium]|nr:hypothetical protein [Bacteriovoracaceae bacterium]
MAEVSEIKSLDEIHYKSKIKYFLIILMLPILFMLSFFNSYPIGDRLKAQIKTHLKGTGCNPDFSEIRMEWFLPKIVVTDLTLPASCLGKQGEALKFNFVTLNWHVINFSPIGIPFRMDTEFAGQPLSVYYVMGFNQQLIRLKDQKVVLSRLEQFMGKFKMAGAVTVDLSLLMSNNLIKHLSLKSVSKDFIIPTQSVEGFTIPPLKVNDFYLEASSEVHPRVNIDKLILGDANSPIRANFKGSIDLMNGNIAFSPLNLTGEVAFSDNFKKTIPLIDMMFQSFGQKDGFYQIRLGGTVGAPKPQAP